MRITSSAFENGDPIPDVCTCEGDDTSPDLSFEGVPDDARPLALIVDDPVAPARVWVHWLAWNVSADMRELPADVLKSNVVEALEGTRQGTTDFDRVGYGGPCPPPGHGTRHYRFTLYALDEHIELEACATRDARRARATAGGPCPSRGAIGRGV